MQVPSLNRSVASRVAGCLVGGAVGDALGAAVEFGSTEAIRRRFGPDGITDFALVYGRRGAITDDTQMTLFTAEGLLRAAVRGVSSTDETVALVHDAYLRWLRTQDSDRTDGAVDGWILSHDELWSRRAPGNTCLSALRSSTGRGEFAHNDSKGCGTVMRVAPVGLIAPDAFELGERVSHLTHGHPTGTIAGGAFAQLISRLVDGLDLVGALVEVRARFLSGPRADEVRHALDQALNLANERAPAVPETIERLGGGWVAEEAFAIGVYCALVAENFAHGVRLAANHSGDSDSTASLTGQLLGVMYGLDAIPGPWREGVELVDVLLQVAQDLHDAREGRLDLEGARQRYA